MSKVSYIESKCLVHHMQGRDYYPTGTVVVLQQLIARLNQSPDEVAPTHGLRNLEEEGGVMCELLSLRLTLARWDSVQPRNGLIGGQRASLQGVWGSSGPKANLYIFLRK